MRVSGEFDRVIDTLTGPAERRVLHWLTAKAPGWVTPDFCTLAALAGALAAGAAYALSNLSGGFVWLATAGIAVHWLGDSLDGALARARGIGRPRYGFFVDHVADTASQAVMLVGLGLSPYVRLSVAALALAGLQLLTVVTFLRACVLGEFRISFGKLGPTEGRIVLVLLNAAMFFGGLAGTRFYEVVVLFFGGLAAFHFPVIAVRDTAILRRAGG